jgi:hypothetical protein
MVLALQVDYIALGYIVNFSLPQPLYDLHTCQRPLQVQSLHSITPAALS